MPHLNIHSPRSDILLPLTSVESSLNEEQDSPQLSQMLGIIGHVSSFRSLI